MAGEWRESTINELCDSGVVELQTGPFGSQLHAYDYVTDGVPVVPTKAIRGRRINHSVLPMVSPAKAAELERHRLQPGDILLARRGVQATGHIGCIREAEDGFLCGTGAIRLRVKRRSDIDVEFLSHVLADPASVEWFKFHAIGATMPNLNEAIIRSFPLLVPPLQEQRAIAHILGTLDDKIELNRGMSETLEAMARAVFKSWFVEFDPVRANVEDRWKSGQSLPSLPSHFYDSFPVRYVPSELGEIPEGWKVRNMECIVTLSREGLRPGDTPEEIFDHYSIPAFDLGRLPRAEPGANIKSSKLAVLPECVLLSKLNPHIPRVWLPFLGSRRRSLCSTEFLVVIPRPGNTREFLFSLFSSGPFRSEFSTLVTGTSGSHQRVRPGAFLGVSTIIPPRDLIEMFTRTVSPMLRQIVRNRWESRTLATLRDTLLPMLISGEIRVKDAERITEKAC